MNGGGHFRGVVVLRERGIDRNVQRGTIVVNGLDRSIIDIHSGPVRHSLRLRRSVVPHVAFFSWLGQQFMLSGAQDLISCMVGTTTSLLTIYIYEFWVDDTRVYPS